MTLSRLLDTSPHGTVLEPLDSHGSCHPQRAAALRHKPIGSSCCQLTKLIMTRMACPLRSMGITPLQHCRVGGGALARWPPSAAQTGRADFPHTAFTKTHSSGMTKKESIEPSSQARTLRTTSSRAIVSNPCFAIGENGAPGCDARSSH